MTNFNDYLAGCRERLEAEGDFLAFVREVFDARRACELTPEVWAETVPWLSEAVFRPLIDSIEDTGIQLGSMRTLGNHLESSGFYHLANEWLLRATDAAEGLDDPLARAQAFCDYGTLLSVTGRDAEAEPYLRRAADAAEGLDDPLTRCNALRHYGTLLSVTGRYSEAEPYLRRAADAAEGLDDPLTRCNALRPYGTLLFVTGRYSEAEPYLRRAADAAEGLDGPLTRCNAFREYGTLLAHTGRDAEAEPYLRRAADAAEGLDGHLTRCNAFLEYGTLLAHTGRDAEAEPYLRRAADAAEGLDDALTRSNAFHDYGRLLSHTGRYAESEPYLRRAADAAEGLKNPVTRCNAFRDYGRYHHGVSRPNPAIRWYEKAQRELRSWLNTNSFPEAIRSILQIYSPVYEATLLSSQNAYLEQSDPAVLLHGMKAADGNKAIWVSAGLSRTESHPLRTGNWAATTHTPPPRPAVSGSPQRAGARGSRSAIASPKCTPTVLKMPDYHDEARPPVRDLLDHIDRLLPDDNTVYVLFDFVKYDLYALPVRRGPDGKARVCHTNVAYFVVENALVPLKTLAKHHKDATGLLHNPAAHPRFADDPPCFSSLPADQLRRELTALAGYDPAVEFDEQPEPLLKLDYAQFGTRLGKALHLDRLLDCIEPDRKKWKDLHLVLLPDTVLYDLPLHAAEVDWFEKPLIDVVASVRYALSLETSLQLTEIEAELGQSPADVVPLRGTAFVHRGGAEDGFDYLPEASVERDQLLTQCPGRWMVFDEELAADGPTATRANLRDHHAGATLLWFTGHGAALADTLTPPGGAETTVVNPSLLLADGPVSAARMVAEGYDLRTLFLWHNSCCLLGRLESTDGHRQVEGYVAALTLLGCRRVTSATWELADHAAAEFARHFLARLRVNVFDNPARSPHAVAVSLKEAMAAFRADKTNGDFDHPYYWAPYALYGLG